MSDGINQTGYADKLYSVYGSAKDATWNVACWFGRQVQWGCGVSSRFVSNVWDKTYPYLERAAVFATTPLGMFALSLVVFSAADHWESNHSTLSSIVKVGCAVGFVASIGFGFAQGWTSPML